MNEAIIGILSSISFLIFVVILSVVHEKIASFIGTVIGLMTVCAFAYSFFYVIGLMVKWVFSCFGFII